MAGFHAKLSPSGAERWMTCTASVEAESHYPDKSSEFAAEGTAAHEIGERCLKLSTDPFQYIGEVITVNESDGKVYKFTVDADMAGHVKDYVKFVNWAISTLTDVRILVERRVYYPSITPEGSGTADCIVTGYDRDGNFVVWIIDLKYGKGVKVEAEHNLQAQLYAIGTIESYDWDWPADPDIIRVTIFQPRLGGESTWDADMAELRATRDRAQNAADDIASGNTKYVPTDKGCGFCRHKARCKARAKANLQALKLRFAEDDE